jgi:hypothetical protein
MPDQILRRVLLFSAGSLLAACAIHKEVSYFAPVPRQEVQVMSTFRGLNEIVKMPVNEKVEIWLIMFDRPAHSSMKVSFNLPSGQSMRFETSKIVATPTTGGQPMIASIKSIRANYIVNGRGSPRDLSTDEELEGASHQYKALFGSVVTVPRDFEIETEFPARLPDHFWIRMPSMRAAGKIVAFPELEFKRKTGSAYQGTPP